MAAAEVVRRMVWGFLRLEWEHIEKYGSCPLSPCDQKALRERTILQSSSTKRGEGSSFSPRAMDKMPISGSVHSHSNDSEDVGNDISTNIFVNMLQWEYAKYFSDWFDIVLVASPRLRKYACGHSFSAHIWMARIVEACFLTTVIIIVVATAALGQ